MVSQEKRLLSKAPASPWMEKELARNTPFPLPTQTTDSERDCGLTLGRERQKKTLLAQMTADGLTNHRLQKTWPKSKTVL